MKFAHLHTHSEYSLLDSMARVDDLVREAAGDGQPGLAITDHGSISGIYTFFQACQRINEGKPKKKHLKPIAGLEAYLAIGDAINRDSEERPAEGQADPDSDSAGDTYTAYYDHLTLLARTNEGWHNLLALHNLSQRKDFFFRKPRIDYGMLKRYGAGLIVLTGCIGGPVAGPIARGDMDGARDNLEKLIDCVGAENVYVEIMDHGHPLEGAEHVRALVELADEYGLFPVVTNDCHHVYDNRQAHDAWLAVGTRSTLATNTFTFEGTGYHLRTSAEMRAVPEVNGWDDLLTEAWTDACNETWRITERIDDWVLDPVRLRMPAFPLPNEYTSSRDLLHDRVYQRAEEMCGGKVSEEVAQRIEMELGIISDLGMWDYFLIAEDMIAWCHRNGIATGVGRGSAAGSQIAYYLGLVGVEALRYNLLFERFLEPGREGMPDIDFDIESARRHDVIEYLRTTYGTDGVALIGAFQNFQSKQSLKDAVRVLGGSPSDGQKLADLIPKKGQVPVKLAEALDTSREAGRDFREHMETMTITGTDGSVHSGREIVDLARSFEFVCRGESVHASGVLISDENLTRLVPLRRDKEDADGVKARICQWDMADVEHFGLLKLDLLGLRNLDVISAVQRNIKQTTGEELDYLHLNDDPDDSSSERVRKAWELMARGRTPGLFQLESAGMTQLIMDIAPENLTELSAVIALYRPGPMSAKMPELYTARKHGEAAIDYSKYTTNPDEAAVIGSVLDETVGCLIYQEQLMRLGQAVAGFDASMRSKLRRAVSKKKADLMHEVGTRFITDAQKEMTLPDGSVKPAFARTTAENLWRDFEGNAEYLFNASHSFAYAQLAFLTAYFKANWPVEYAAALLANTPRGEKRDAAMASFSEEGIVVASPDINTAQMQTVAVDGQVSIGLEEIKEVPQELAHSTVEERERNGEYASFADFITRLKPNTRGVIALIEAGAFDAFGPRKGLARLYKMSAGAGDVPVPKDEWEPFERAARQRIRLGVTLDDDPLSDKEIQRRARKACLHRDQEKPSRPLTDLGGVESGQAVKVFATLTSFTERAYSGGTMANVIISMGGVNVRGVMWDAQLRRLKQGAGAPTVGYPVLVGGTTTLRTYTVTTTDPLTGEEVEEESEPKIELRIEAIRVLDEIMGRDTHMDGDFSRLASIIPGWEGDDEPDTDGGPDDDPTDEGVSEPESYDAYAPDTDVDEVVDDEEAPYEDESEEHDESPVLADVVPVSPGCSLASEDIRQAHMQLTSIFVVTPGEIGGEVGNKQVRATNGRAWADLFPELPAGPRFRSSFLEEKRSFIVRTWADDRYSNAVIIFLTEKNRAKFGSLDSDQKHTFAQFAYATATFAGEVESDIIRAQYSWSVGTLGNGKCSDLINSMVGREQASLRRRA